MNKQEFFSKLESEGGYYELWKYGLLPEEIEDEDIRHYWSLLWHEFERADELIDMIDRLEHE